MPQERKTRNLDHVAAIVFGRPWAILPADMDVVVGVVGMYLDGVKPTAQEAETAAASRPYGAERTGESTDTAQTVRVIPLHGTINNRADEMDRMSGGGGTSPQAFARKVRTAADDPNVVEIIVDVDSGGGTVDGTRAMYEAVQYAAGKKPVTAVANGAMCSAAFWAVAPASRIVATRTATVGSIGIIAAWRDVSRAMEQDGIKAHYYRSGEQKALGGPGEPMGEHLDATLREMVDDMFEVFITDVAAARGVSVPAARERWGSGRTWIGQQAVTVGLADSLGTLQEEIDRAVSGQRPPLRSRLAAQAPPGDHLIAQHALTPTTHAQATDLGVRPAALSPSPEDPPMKIRLQAADGTFHEFDPSDITGMQAFLRAQMQAAVTSTILSAYTALGVAVEAGTTPTNLDTQALQNLRLQAADGVAYRTGLIEQIASLTITTQGNDERGQQAAERQKRVWAGASVDDLRAEVERLQGVRDGMFPSGPVGKGGTGEKPKSPVRAFYGRR